MERRNVKGFQILLSWDVFVYPHAGPQTSDARAKREGVVVTPDMAAAKGGKVLWMPSPINDE